MDLLLLEQGLALFRGNIRFVPLTLSVQATQELANLYQQGREILQPVPPTQAALEQMIALLGDGKIEEAKRVFANDVGHQMARNYADGRVVVRPNSRSVAAYKRAHGYGNIPGIRTGLLARELLSTQWSCIFLG